MHGLSEPANRHERLVVAICTYHRPRQLERLLDGLSAIDLPSGLDVRVLIVDNAATPSDAARRDLGTKPEPVQYVHHPTGGIVGARNAALAARLPGEHLVFVDDDEWPTTGWLRELWHGHQRFPHAIIAGPVVRVDAARRPVHATAHRPDGTAIEACGFGNVLLPAELLERTGLTFDPRYTRSGGEDADFCLRAAAGGSEVRFVPAALCYEEMGTDRHALGFRLKQAFTQAAVYSDMHRRRARTSAIRRLTVGLAHIAVGVVLLLRAATPRGGVTTGLIRIWTGCGALAGVLGYLPSRY